MTDRDVLITRVHDALGLPMSASPNVIPEQVEQLWAVTAEGHQSLTIHPLTTTGALSGRSI